MTTAYPLPPQTVPARGAVQRTFVKARALAGFTDENHFNLTCPCSTSAMAKRTLREDAFRPRAGDGPDFRSMQAIGGVVVIPVFLVIMLWAGGTSLLVKLPLGFWVTIAASFAYSVYLLVKET